MRDRRNPAPVYSRAVIGPRMDWHYSHEAGPAKELRNINVVPLGIDVVGVSYPESFADGRL
jgi:hypothetical protein